MQAERPAHFREAFAAPRRGPCAALAKPVCALAFALVLGPLVGAARQAEAASCEAGAGPPLQRLSHGDLSRTVQDLLGNVMDVPKVLAGLERIGADEATAEAAAGVVGRLEVQKMVAWAEAVAAAASVRPEQLLGCAPNGDGEERCVRRWIEQFGRRVSRRPLTSTEVDRLAKDYQQARITREARDAVAGILQTMLQSPSFLYRLELGDSRGRPTDWEMASRLSYLLWGTMPDDGLFARAQKAQLHTPAQIRTEATRMLADPRARDGLRRFFIQFFDVGDLAYREEETPKGFKGVSEPAKLLEAQFARFIDDVLWGAPKGRLQALFTLPVTFVNGPLAAYYELGEAKGDELVRIEAPDRLAGALTQPAFLFAHAKRKETDPVRRGIFVREQLLCQPPAPPPDNVDFKLPKSSDALVTLRDRIEDHRLEAGCAKCHKLIDPLGLAFESWDHTGRFRTEDNGRAVDTTGDLLDTDVDGAFAGGIELSKRLAKSQTVRSCFVRQAFRFGMGRRETPSDTCTLEALERSFSRSGNDMRGLFVALTSTSAFATLGEGKK